VKSNIGIALGLLVFALLIHIGFGSSENISPLDTLREIMRGDHNDSGINRIIWLVRLPRALQCILTGAILGATGTIFQALFRNPLAEPYIVGASSGAAVGGVLVQVLGLGSALLGFAMPLAGFVTGLLTLVLVFSLAIRRGVIETPTLLLAGVVISTMLSSVLSMILMVSGHDQGVVLRWLLGSEAEATFQNVQILFLVFSIGFFLLLRLSRYMNAIAVDEETAQSVGVDPGKLRSQVLSITTAMVATLVGTVGIIGFVGLVAPHISRRIVGVDLRKVLPLATVIGALLLLMSDAIAQRLTSGGLPVGIVTAILGAPSLLVLLKRN
jgi:iron complex transport system permease protein